ncbi:opacity protein-like surface antigen [Dysgonomonas hofstadii]|uniref:Opacity protein-like surface antigen n=1 Tax=Dysgonomonas hofstadii TaxID=637886 RepID=A0A840CW41_9BACT|nr:outer membrane beta-barrel protein [Dysgonomonas hofstadii]MBB4037025.1 opacity protein-like surface antigen [Dysgonomonas hofstadii]
MKRILVTFAILVGIMSTASAQDAGQIWVGGSVGFSTSKTDDFDRLYQYNILPEIGYILSDSWGLGIRLGYTHSENNYAYPIPGYSYSYNYTKEKNNGFTVNPFVRYTFLKGDIGSVFVDGGVGYTHSKAKLEEKDDMSDNLKDWENKIKELEVGFRPGVAIKVSGKVVLTAKYGFIGYQNRKEGDVKSDSFDLNFDFRQAAFGVNFIF